MKPATKVNRPNRGASKSVRYQPERSFKKSCMKALGALATLVVITGAAYGVFMLVPKVSPEVSHVVVEGEFKYLDEARLAEAIYTDLQGGILGLDIAAMQNRIAEVAWVKTVEVIRQFPSTLIVSIVEEQAIARWNEQGYISRDGEFIESLLFEELAHLPQLGSDMAGLKPEVGARQAIELFHLLNSAVLVAGESISELRQSAVGGWSMTWASGLGIDLGRVDHLNRARHALAAWQRLPAQTKEKIEQIDARYDNGVAVRKRVQIATENDSGILEITEFPEVTDNPA